MPIIESIKSRKIRRSRNSSNSVEQLFKIYGTPNQSTAHDTLDTHVAPQVISNGRLLVLEYTETDPEDGSEDIFVGRAVYSQATKQRAQETPRTGDAEFSFDVVGETFRLLHSLATTKFPASGFSQSDLPDFKNAINVQDDKIEGADILEPKTTYTETHFLSSNVVTQAYVDALSTVVGKTNSGLFRQFDADRLLLTRVAGRKRGIEDWQVTFDWAIGQHVSGKTIAGVQNVTKKAWEFLWVLYETFEDTTSKRLIKRPVGVYVETTYESANYGVLQIGS